LIDSLEKENLFASIVAENSRWLRIIARQNPRDETWHDLEQDILLALWRSIDRYEQRSNLATWLYAIAINRAKDFKRKKQNAERPRGIMTADPDRTHQRAYSDAVEIAEEFAQYSFYKVVAHAFVFVFGQLVIHFLDIHAPPFDALKVAWLFVPLVFLLLSFIYGVLKIPSLVNGIFIGRAGDMALPRVLT
jgi:RNA polymerase sigma factor (sigma-70 family)